jgi:hypothetical protein
MAVRRRMMMIDDDSDDDVGFGTMWFLGRFQRSVLSPSLGLK